jgi:TRAP-type transport system periplasmic protein
MPEKQGQMHREEGMNAKIAVLLAVVLGSVMSICPPALAAGPVDLKISTFEPVGNHYTVWLQHWADMLAERSGGQLKATIYPSNQMGAMPRQYDLARTGVADVIFTMHGVTPGRFPLAELSHVPFVVPNAEVGSQALTSLLPKYLAGEHKGVHVLALSTGGLALFTSKVAVHRPEDLKGLRIRHPDSIAAATLTSLGAVPVYTETAQIADAMNKGTIDGALLAWEALDSFQVRAKYATDWGGNITTFVLAMNPDTYNGLPADLKKIVDDTTGEAAARGMGKGADAAAEEGRAFARKSGVEIIDLTPAERKAFDDASKPAIAKIIADNQAKGLPAAAFVDDFKAAVGQYSAAH